MKQTTLNHSILTICLVLALAAPGLRAAPNITSVSRSADQVGKYAKLELTVAITATFTNAYDPDEIDLWGEFMSPSHKAWRVNGFYDGAQWRIRRQRDRELELRRESQGHERFRPGDARQF